jgi:hypothetical protein
VELSTGSFDVNRSQSLTMIRSLSLSGLRTVIVNASFHIGFNVRLITRVYQNKNLTIKLKISCQSMEKKYLLDTWYPVVFMTHLKLRKRIRIAYEKCETVSHLFHPMIFWKINENVPRKLFRSVRFKTSLSKNKQNQ